MSYDDTDLVFKIPLYICISINDKTQSYIVFICLVN